MFDFPYAPFILPAFVVTIVVFAAMIALSLNHSRRWRRRYEALAAQAKAAPPKPAAPKSAP